MCIPLGFKFAENMYGTHNATTDPTAGRRFAFHIDAVSDSVWRTLRDGRVEATGFVDADGFAVRSPLRGFMVIRPFLARRIRYEFEFAGGDGVRYRFVGEKAIRHLHPVRSWTTLPGEIRDNSGREVARCLLHFDRRELGPFLRSFRPLWRSRRMRTTDA